MSLGVGLFTALAVAASTAGWWAPVALGSAAVVSAALVRRGGPPRDRPGAVLAAVAEWAMLVVFATIPASYLASVTGFAAMPAAPSYGLVAGGVVVVAVGAALSRPEPLRPLPRFAGTAALIGFAAAFVAICLAIAPVTDTLAEIAPPSPSGLLSAVIVLIPLFRGLRGARLAAGAALAAVVGIAALYQLGPARLGLSVTSSRDALAAADAEALTTMLVLVAVAGGVLATVAAARRTVSALDPLAGPVGGRRRTHLLVATVGAALSAAVLGPALVWWLAGLATLADAVHRSGARRRSGGRSLRVRGKR